jgi:hypothetical protein
MDATGTIIAVLPAQTGISQRTGNTWMSQDYVLEIPAQYPRHICFRIFGEDRIKQFNIRQGEQNVTIQFELDAHEYQGRWYNEVRAFNVLRAMAAQPVQSVAVSQQPQQPQQPQQADGLPF